MGPLLTWITYIGLLGSMLCHILIYMLLLGYGWNACVSVSLYIALGCLLELLHLAQLTI